MTPFNPVFPQDTGPVGIYIHVPFCSGRCSYCGFVTNRHDPALEERYIQAVLKEIDLWSGPDSLIGTLNSEVDTIYLGGGTPSILKPENVATLIHRCKEKFRTTPDPEVTIEVNPATVDLNGLKYFREAGVNRLSLGIQSFDDNELAAMGRQHSSSDGLTVFRNARAADFENISIDLIAGFPGQSLASIQRGLSTALELQPEHLSIYLLEVKEGTDLEARIRKGRIQAPDDDLMATLYEYICETLAPAGYEHYEISNFARQGRVSRHNLKYWNDDIYVAMGPGAHGMTGRNRYVNVENLDNYTRFLHENKTPFSSLTQLTAEIRFKDALIMGTRLVEGIDLRLLGERYKVDAESFVKATIGDLSDSGLFEIDGNRLILSPRGRLLSNIVFSRWV
jgi:oxygen-independent coproporphyrinogen III oxidase